MSRTVTVVTPENIRVTYQLAGIASRFMALLVDLLLQIGLLIVGEWLFSLLAGAGFGIGSVFSAVGIIYAYTLIFFYSLIFESLWAGRTPGKKLFGLRVIREGGYPVTFVSSAIRSIMRFIDFGIIPFPSAQLILCGTPGLLCIFFSGKYKRIGDYAAGTLVIVEAGVTPYAERNLNFMTPAVGAMLPTIKNLDRLTDDEYKVVRRFTARRNELDLTVQAGLGERIARPLMEKLESDAPIIVQLQFADWLEALERRYAEERGIL